jgi:diacylglycerol kinase (ATP)
MKGLAFAFKSEAAFRLECYVLLLTLILISFTPLMFMEQILLVGSVLFVMVVELLNTAIEKTVDRISKDRHDLSGAIKDIGSAAVLIAILIAGLIWMIVGYRHFS